MAFVIEDVLAPFRALEANEHAIPVLDDDNAMRVLAAWTQTENTWEPPEGAKAPPARAGKMESLWRWVVSGWDVEALVQKVSRAAGVPVDIAHRKLEMLIGNRLIYPDGSMAKGARAALNVYTAKKLGIKQQRASAAPKDEKPKDDDRSN